MIVAVLSLICGTAIICMSLTFPKGTDGVPGPGIFPIIIGAMMIVSAVLLIIRTTLTKKEGNGSLAMLSPEKKRVYLTMLVLVVYFILLPYIGFCVSSFIMLLLLIKWYSRKSILKSIILAAVITAIVYLLFSMVLNVPLSFGLLM